MDFLKTLLIYMTAAFTFAVESTTAPEVTPVPTPSPTPAVTATVSAELTPEPTVSVTPAPVPKVTANLSYKNLTQGTKSSEVRKLQERLIELGYLPEGSADGNYGNQTRRAVSRFQYYNGLTQDGVAGRMTQTYLYENPDVAPYPTAAASVTEAPAETEQVPEEQPEKTPEQLPVPEGAEMTPENAAATTFANTADPEGTVKEEQTGEQSHQFVAEKKPIADPQAGAPVPESLMPVTGSVVLNDAGAPVSRLMLQDGVTVTELPRLWRRNDILWISLVDLSNCLEGWTLTMDQDNAILEAEGYTVVMTKENGQTTILADGAELSFDTECCLPDTVGLPVNESFLRKALGAEVLWESEENTLLLRIRSKALANSPD